MQIVESKADAVRGMFDHYEATNSTRETHAWLRDQYGVDLPYNTIRNMLRNSLYCGEYRGNVNYCPAIISREQFENIQKSFRGRERTEHGKANTVMCLRVCCAARSVAAP